MASDINEEFGAKPLREELKEKDFDDIEKEIMRLKSEGIRLLNENPKQGADNKLICFLHPKDTNGVLIELCQDIK